VGVNQDFADRRIVVTGGASGIGRATCEALAERGAHVLVVDIDDEGARAVAREIGGTSVGADLGEIATSIKAIAEQAETVDGLVNAAGIVEPHAFPDTDPDDWRRVFRINLEAPHFLAQGLLPHFRRPGAAIVNVTSVSAETVLATSGATTPAYAASKAGLERASRSLAYELAEAGIRVNTVAPGYVRTPLTDEHADAHTAAVIEQIPFRRWGSPVEIAAAIVFLLSDSASYITGGQLVVDGGLTLSSAQSLP
jgi:NAD(P)-dependent dehydrogenase (short-subunit alcohol dehydrogenase family)